MLGYLRLRETEYVGKLSDGSLPRYQHVEDLATVHFGDCVEDV
jgi:hypothetical protein